MKPETQHLSEDDELSHPWRCLAEREMRGWACPRGGVGREGPQETEVPERGVVTGVAEKRRICGATKGFEART